MEAIIEYIDSLHNVVQGALGSALCLIVVKYSGILFSWLLSQVSRLNKNINRKFLQAKWTPLNAIDASEKEVKTLSYVLCLYPAFHNLIKAIIFLSLGVWLSIYSDLYAVSAIACALYFLFLSLSYIPDLGSFGTKEERKVLLKEIDNKLDELANK